MKLGFTKLKKKICISHGHSLGVPLLMQGLSSSLIGWLVRHPWFNNPSWYVFYRPTKWCCSWQWKRLIEYGGKLFEMAGLDWPTNPAGDTHFTAGSKISSSQSSSSAIRPLLKSGQHFFILIFSAILLLESSGQIMGNKGSLHICMEPAEIRSRSHCLNQQNYFQYQLKLILVWLQKDSIDIHFINRANICMKKGAGRRNWIQPWTNWSTPHKVSPINVYPLWILWRLIIKCQ